MKDLKKQEQIREAMKFRDMRLEKHRKAIKKIADSGRYKNG